MLLIQENPYLQFFSGLPGYQEEKPFDSSTMVYFRKRLDAVTLTEINEKINDYALVKAKAEFGAKLNISISSNGMARIEKTRFYAYNEASVLVQAFRRFYDRNNCYPEGDSRQ